MGEPIQFPVGRGFDRAYWLSRCEGFLVQDAEGMRIGTVVEFHYHSRVDQPDELAVRAGRFGHRLLVYRTEAVQEIMPGPRALVGLVPLRPSTPKVRAGRSARSEARAATAARSARLEKNESDLRRRAKESR